MNLEQLLEIAHKNTRGAGLEKKLTMMMGWAINLPKFTQAFESTARPYNYRVPRPSANGGTIVSDCVGYKKLTIWVEFGDNAEWSGPRLSWMYQDNSMRCMGPVANGDENDLDGLANHAQLMRDEGLRILDAEAAYLREHPSLDGFQMDGYLPA